MKYFFLVIILFSDIGHAAQPDPYFCMKGFFYAEEGRSEDLLQFLKEDQKTVPSCQESFRYKGLLLPHYIIEKNYEKVYSALIEGVGANWEAYYDGKGDDSITLLQLAIVKNQNSLIDLLLDKGANVNRRFSIFYPGKVPLQVVMEDWQDQNYALKFIGKNLDVSVLFSNGAGIQYSPAMVALNLGWDQTLKALLDKGLNPNTLSPVVDKGGYVRISQSIPLVVGAVLGNYYDKIPLLQILLDSGADINACSIKEYGSKQTTMYCALSMVAGYLDANSTVDSPVYLWLKFASKYNLSWQNLTSQYDDHRSPIELAVSRFESLSELKLLVSLGFPIGPDKNTITSYKDFVFNLTKISHGDAPMQYAYEGYILIDHGWFESLKVKGQAKDFHDSVFNYMLEGVSDNDLIAQIQKFLTIAQPQYAFGETIDSAVRKLFGRHDPDDKTIRWAESAGFNFKSYLNDLLEQERKGEETILGLFNKNFRIDYVAATAMKLGYFQFSDKELIDVLTYAFHSGTGSNFNAAAELAEGKNITIHIESKKLSGKLFYKPLDFSKLFENSESVRIIMRSIENQDEADANMLIAEGLKTPNVVVSPLQNNLLLLYAGLSSATFLPNWPGVSLKAPSPNDGKASLCAMARREGTYSYIAKYCEKPIEDLINE